MSPEPSSFTASKEDHEIFDLVSALEAAEGALASYPVPPTTHSIIHLILGKGTTFYSWLEVTPSSTSAEISRAYKKKSMQLQYVMRFRLLSARA